MRNPGFSLFLIFIWTIYGAAYFFADAGCQRYLNAQQKKKNKLWKISIFFILLYIVKTKNGVCGQLQLFVSA